jgi:glutaredoxin-related protein
MRVKWWRVVTYEMVGPLKYININNTITIRCQHPISFRYLLTKTKTKMISVIFKMYSKTNCEFCVQCKDIITDMLGHDDAREFQIINDPAPDVVDGLKETHDHYTYPFIFFDGKFVGGFTELVVDSMRITDVLIVKYNKDPDRF